MSPTYPNEGGVYSGPLVIGDTFRVYASPSSQAYLHDRGAKHGTVLSQFEPGTSFDAVVQLVGSQGEVQSKVIAQAGPDGGRFAYVPDMRLWAPRDEIRAVWRGAPSQIRFRYEENFGKYPIVDRNQPAPQAEPNLPAGGRSRDEAPKPARSSHRTAPGFPPAVIRTMQLQLAAAVASGNQAESARLTALMTKYGIPNAPDVDYGGARSKSGPSQVSGSPAITEGIGNSMRDIVGRGHGGGGGWGGHGGGSWGGGGFRGGHGGGIRFVSPGWGGGYGYAYPGYGAFYGYPGYGTQPCGSSYAAWQSSIRAGAAPGVQAGLKAQFEACLYAQGTRSW